MIRFQKTCICLSIAAMSAVSTTLAEAAFLNGVETFDGTTLDTTTWQPYSAGTASIAQNDRLSMSGLVSGDAADYTTRTVAIGIGQGVRVDFEIPANNSATSARLYLTNNSEGDTDTLFNDSQRLSVTFSPERGTFFYFEGSSGGTFTSAGLANQPYQMELLRVASDKLRYSAYQSDGTLINSVERTLTGTYDDELFIGLGIAGPESTLIFDNVTIIPEPNSAGLLFLGCVGLFARRRR